MKRKLGMSTAIVLALYLLLLAALTAVESAQPSSGIRSFSDALWYSIVTITTVGYGDLYPVSSTGRIIGLFFLLLSAGFLTFLISTAYSLLRGRFWPALCLRAGRGRQWYVYSRANDASLALATQLEQKQPGSLQVFCSASPDEAGRMPEHRRIFMEEDIRQLFKRFPGNRGGRTAFLIAEDELQNCDDAYALRGQGLHLYCRSAEISGMQEISFFNPYEICARKYWLEHPLGRAEGCVLLVGDGFYAQALLSSAVISNCRVPVLTTQYHMAGDWSSYLRRHHCLAQAVAINCEKPGTDALFFHEGAWNADPSLIARVDRIIFCFDDQDENARCAQLLERSFAHSSAVYARTSRSMVPGTCFGSTENLYTPELVMKRSLDSLAMQMHALYCRSTGKDMPAWDTLNNFLRESNRAAADHIPTKIRLLLDAEGTLSPEDAKLAAQRWQEASETQKEACRQNEHARWLRFYSLHNWQYAPERSDAARRHPCIVPYGQLSHQEQMKDDYAWQQLAACAEIQEQP